MKPCKTQYIAIASTFILLTGCVTNGSQQTWVKTSASNNMEQERATADSECLARAYEVFTENPMPSNNCIGACKNNTSGFSSGFIAGSAAKQSREIRNAREKFYESCMLSKGWKKQVL